MKKQKMTCPIKVSIGVQFNMDATLSTNDLEMLRNNGAAVL